MHVKLNEKLFRTVMSTMSYGAETETWALRWMYAVIEKNRIRKELVRGTVKGAPLAKKITAISLQM